MTNRERVSTIDVTGTIFDVKRFAVHDGPGIRTTVFLKGCPMECLWCQNPEGMSRLIELWYFPSKCIRCHECVAACPEDALSVSTARPHIRIDRGSCTLCGECVRICPSGALAFDGRIAGAGEVEQELLKDRLFYEVSGGGVTLSGGEPLYQPDFSLEILRRMKSQGIHAAVDTCLHSDPAVVERFLPVTDLFLADVKIMHSSRHESFTGMTNERIRSNFECIAAAGAEVVVRIPLVPGFTADEENVRSIAAYVHSVRADIPVELLNYNPLAENKYRIRNLPYPPGFGAPLLPEDEIDRLKAVAEAEGVACVE